MLVPPGPPGSWGSFAQAPGPSQDLRYAPDTSSNACPSTNPFAGDDDSDQFIGADIEPTKMHLQGNSGEVVGLLGK